MNLAAQHAVGRQRPRATPRRCSPWHQSRWAAARLLFYAYLGLCIGTLGLAGVLTGPLMTWYIYGDWRMWRYWHSAKRLYPHAYKMLWYMLQGRNGGYMLDVPLTAPPSSGVDPERVELQPTWEFGQACGPCTRCCSKVGCPVLDKATGLCRGYNSFFWRYFNCGRFPTEQRQIDYYLCHKWRLKELPPPRPAIAILTEEREGVVA